MSVSTAGSGAYSILRRVSRDRVRVGDRVSGRVRVSVRVRDRVRACRPDSSGNLLTWRKMEFTSGSVLCVHILHNDSDIMK